MMRNAYGSSEYRQQDVMGASPIHLVVMAYDLAINACEQKDFAQATQTVSVLRDALNFDYSEAALGLFRLYQWCLDCIRREDYESSLLILRELRQAWSMAEKQAAPAVPQLSRATMAYAGVAA